MEDKKGKLLRESIEYSVKIIHLYDGINRLGFMKNQLARAATSIGANVHEAEYAESPEDFVHKLKIALKEYHESEYWLMVLGRCVPELADEVERLRKDAGAIRYMLIASIRTRLRNLRA